MTATAAFAPNTPIAAPSFNPAPFKVLASAALAVSQSPSLSTTGCAKPPS